jgi:glycosyltransferase involved in cell wall biosynthesis
MSKTFVFTSYELYPINAGGCGVFLYYAIQELLQDLENKVIILLDMPKHECIMFEEKHQSEMPNGRNLRIICLSEWISDSKLEVEYSNVFLEKSHRFYKGIQKIVNSEEVNYIEFFDYVGIGYFTLKAKKYNNEFDGIQFGVRAHCTIDLMDIEQVPNGFDINKLQMYQMEKEAIQDADFLLVPSNAWGEIYQTRYGVNQDNIIISPPPVKKWDDISYVLTEDQQDVLFYGRIFQLKGVDMFIDAAVSFMCLRPESENIFYLVGYDGLDAKNVPYKNELLDRIPVELRDRFVFTGNLNHSQLETLLKTVRFAVFPNYVESFCYSIHEIYNLGVPIICNEIPAFKDYFKNGENSLVYNGTSNGLLSNLLKLYDNEDIRLKISKPYDLLDNSKFVSSYKEIMNNYRAVELDYLTCFDQLEKNEALCSLVVIMENQSLTFSFEELMEDKMVDKNSIYMLFNEAPGTPIHFLGKLRYVRKIDGSIDNSLEILNYVLVCYADDKFNPNYLKDAVKILTNNTQLKYVGAQFTNRLYCNYPSLLEPDTYWQSTFLNRIIIKNSGENNTIRDIYDVRFKELGEKKLLAQEGYILPSAYITLGEHPDLEVSDESYLFITHHNSRSKEWIPSILYPFILKTNISTQSKFDMNMRFSHYAKKKYHKLRYKVDQMQGVKGKSLSFLLNFLHRQFKKSF